MKNFAFLLALVLLSACGGNKENTSSTGDVHGDGRCTQRFVDAYNLLVMNMDADHCSAFKANHGGVSCRLELLSSGVTTVSYASKFQARCEPLIETRTAPMTKANTAVTPASGGDVDSLFIKDLDPKWIKVVLKDYKYASERVTTVLDGQVYSLSEYLNLKNTDPKRTERQMTVCGSIMTNASIDVEMTPTRVTVGNEKDVVFVFDSNKKLTCVTTTPDKQTHPTTVKQMKEAFGNTAIVTVLKK
jgi:hypothetical protein